MPVPNKDIKLFPAALKALRELKSQKQWVKCKAQLKHPYSIWQEGVQIGLASRTDEVRWAHKLLKMFKIFKGKTIEDIVDFKVKFL